MPITYFQSLLNGGTINGALVVTGNISTTGVSNISAAGNLFSALGSVDTQTAGGGLKVAEGSNARQGRSTLVAGTVTVANTSTLAGDEIMVTSQVDGGTPGFQRVSARTAGTSFTITSSSGTDTSSVGWEMMGVG